MWQPGGGEDCSRREGHQQEGIPIKRVTSRRGDTSRRGTSRRGDTSRRDTMKGHQKRGYHEGTPAGGGTKKGYQEGTPAGGGTKRGHQQAEDTNRKGISRMEHQQVTP